MNVYHSPQYQTHRRNYDFLFCEAYRTPGLGGETELGEGYSLVTDCFGSTGPNYRVSRHQLLDFEGRVVYTWDNIDDDGEFCTLISHTNSRHYLIFREDLYGYSVLEVETGETLHYIPEKSWPLDGGEARETFIWTGAAYDPRTSLLAVSGCYWACPNGTLLLDFTDPLEEQDWKQWLDFQDVVNPDLDIYDDIDLERFGEDGLIYFRTSSAEDGTQGELTFPTEQALALIQAKKSTDKE